MATPRIQFRIPKGLIEIRKMGKEYPVCSYFGCGKRLNLVEELSGNRCINHSGIKNIDPIKVFKFC